MKKCINPRCSTYIMPTGNGRVDKKKYCSSVCHQRAVNIERSAKNKLARAKIYVTNKPIEEDTVQ